MTLRILLADDHRMILDGLRSLIDHEADMQVVAESTNGEDACSLWDEKKPDVAIMDVSMPVLNGIDAMRRMLAGRKEGRVVALSMHSDPRYVREALKAGARGYILKESAFGELICAIRDVSAGRLFLSASLGASLMEEFVVLLRQGGETRPERLSSRERQVLQRLAEGRSTKEIAADLHLSIKTIETHRSQIMHKLDLHSIAELTKYAIREGLTSLD